MPVGVPGYTLREELRRVPSTEPPVLPVNKDLKYIGKPTSRWDAHAMVSGTARYTADIQLPGMLYAKFVNAAVPHAKILSVDTSVAENYPGVKGVHVIQHVRGRAAIHGCPPGWHLRPTHRAPPQPPVKVAKKSAA